MREKEFSDKFLAHLNQAQRKAVETIDGATLILAVPGSGKTTVLVTRLGYMLYVKQIDPKEILTVTYTVAATREMKHRFTAMFGSDYSKALEFKTINGLSAKIIEYYTRHHGKGWSFQLLSNEAEIKGKLRGICQDLTKEYPAPSTIQDIRTAITYIKNMMIPEDQIDQLDRGIPHLAEILKRYRSDLLRNKLMDFDDQMVYALKILQSHPQVLLYFQQRYRYICVDESQDTSKIQHAIIKLLAQRSGNLFLVGDEDQSIYGFRGAYPEALVQFSEEYANGKVLLIEQNYRSSREIIDAANEFVRKNRFRHEKMMVPTRGKGGPIQVIDAADREAQYQFLFETARSAASETAVLFRNNDSALPLIDLLDRGNVPFRCRIREEGFFSHRVTADITDIINFACDASDPEIFMRIYYKLNMGLTREAAAQACAQTKVNGKPILENLKDSTLLSRFAREEVVNLMILLPMIVSANGAKAIGYIRSSGYGQYVTKNGLDSGKIEILKMLGRNQPSPKALLDRLSKLQEIIRHQTDRDSGHFILSTIHSSKGLEYDQVYLLDVLDGILPVNGVPDQDDEAEIQEYEEARRVYYVGMTRAKNRLCLFRCLQSESAFTDEVVRSLPVEVMEQDSIFASLGQPMCNRTYTHRAKGKGTVKAQNGTLLLVEYEDGDADLMDLTQLFAERKIITSGAASTRRAEKKRESSRRHDQRSGQTADALSEKSKPGMKMIHAKFGRGVVVQNDGASITIRFSKTGKVRKFDLKLAADHLFIE